MTDIIQEILDELERADIKHGPMREPVEGLYTIKCELTELEREVMRRAPSLHTINRRREAVQVAAMAMKFLRDCC